jgi:hypothetical protein
MERRSVDSGGIERLSQLKVVKAKFIQPGKLELKPQGIRTGMARAGP